MSDKKNKTVLAKWQQQDKRAQEVAYNLFLAVDSFFEVYEPPPDSPLGRYVLEILEYINEGGEQP